MEKAGARKLGVGIAHMVIHFMDGTRIMFRYPKQAGHDAATIAATVKKALETDKIVVEAQGALLVIPGRNIKYVQITPVPDELPKGILRHAEIVG